MKEGFYSVAYKGLAGSGFGMLALDTGAVVGADAMGGVYDGSYAFNPATNLVDLEIMAVLPAGLWPVQTGVPLQKPISFPVKVSLPRAVGVEKSAIAQTPLGPVTVLFRKIRNFPR